MRPPDDFRADSRNRHADVSAGRFATLRPRLLDRDGALAIAAAGLHLARTEAPERVIGGTYIALAAVAALALPLVWIHAGPIAGGLAVAGVLLYVAGALAYHYRRPDPAPSVFGYHEVFHALVCAGATCHYVAVFILLT